MEKQYSKEFLQELMSYPDRTVYAKVVALGQDNVPIVGESPIVGVVTGGSINIDGASALRRTCSLSLTTNEIDEINDYIWVYETRFSLAIGLKNELKSQYPNYDDIIWFPQGVFIITQFNWSLNTNGCNISISGQDKMCLLNGEVKGTLTTTVDFANTYIEDPETKKMNIETLTLQQIITNIVHIFAGEPLANISINLPNNSSFNLVEYYGSKPLYLLMQEDREDLDEEGNPKPDKYVAKNMTIYQDQIDDNEIKISEMSNYFIPANKLNGDPPEKGDTFTLDGQGYYVDIVGNREIAGYQDTELTYAGELIGKPGETLVSILDKIKNMLGEFEYFFDIEGKFIFQQKKTSQKILYEELNPLGGKQENIEKEDTTKEEVYEFSDMSLFTSFANTPNIKNLKNDFTVWGTRKSITGSSLPIHMRLAIDKKPTEYISTFQKKDEQGNRINTVYSAEEYDWRELIYQMARDYYNWNQKDEEYYQHLCYANDNETEINKWITILAKTEDGKVIDARTGYEEYYTDMLGFWRDLYNPEADDNPTYSASYYNNDSEQLYIHPWKQITVEDDKGVIDFSKVKNWYVQKSTVVKEEEKQCYIRWIDSIDLSPSPDEYYTLDVVVEDGKETKEKTIVPETSNSISIRHLYSYNSILDKYEPILQQDFSKLKGAFYIKHPFDGGVGVMPLDKYCANYILPHNAQISINSLFWKEHKTNNYTPFVKQYNIKDLTEQSLNKIYGNLLDGIYLKDRDGTLTKIYGVKMKLPSMSSFILPGAAGGKWPSGSSNLDEAVKISLLNLQTEQIIYYKKEGTDNNTIPCPADKEIILLAYDFKQPLINDQAKEENSEENNFTLFINHDGRYKTLIEYLAEQGYYAGKKIDNNETIYNLVVLDELSLYVDKDTPFINQMNISRDNLYIKQIINEIEDFLPFYEILKIDNVWVKNKEEFKSVDKIAGTTLEPFETFYLTNWKGEFITDLEKSRAISYYTKDKIYGEDYWNLDIKTAPQNLAFYLDFIKADEKEDLLYDYSIQKIGRRNMVKSSDSNVTAIYYPDTPNVYYGMKFQIPEQFDKYFNISTQGRSAYDVLNELLYNHTYVTESITITSIPLYYLQPNTRIKVKRQNQDEEYFEEYFIDKITIPLAYNGTMSITATKAPPKQNNQEETT